LCHGCWRAILHRQTPSHRQQLVVQNLTTISFQLQTCETVCSCDTHRQDLELPRKMIIMPCSGYSRVGLTYTPL
jgi:hypothetical protein